VGSSCGDGRLAPGGAKSSQYLKRKSQDLKRKSEDLKRKSQDLNGKGQFDREGHGFSRAAKTGVSTRPRRDQRSPPTPEFFHLDASRNQMYYRQNPRRSCPGTLEFQLRRWWR
jgi:hypothetical protein